MNRSIVKSFQAIPPSEAFPNMFKVDVAPPVHPAQPAKANAAVPASKVPAGAAARQGEARIPAAAPLNPTFIHNETRIVEIRHYHVYEGPNLAA